MQPDTITVSIDPEETGTPYDVTFTRISEAADASTYVVKGVHESNANPYQLELKRTAPKPSGDRPGVKRPVIKLRRGVSSPDINGTDIQQISLLTVEGSLPDGIADTDDRLNRAIITALLGHDDITDLFKYLEV